VHLYCNLQSRALTHGVLVMGLYELLGNPTTYYPGPPVLCVSIHILNVCFSSYELIRLSSMQQVIQIVSYLWIARNSYINL
jgi:hypothetical protein